MLIAKREKVQDKEIRTGEGRGARRRGMRQGVVFTLVCCTNAHPPSPTLLFPILVAFCCESISVFNLETMDLPFPQCLISDPWQNGHLIGYFIIQCPHIKENALVSVVRRPDSAISTYRISDFYNRAL